MRMHALMILAVSLLIAADAPKEDAANKDKEKLQGTWQALQGEIFGFDGKDLRVFKAPPEEIEKQKLIIKGGLD